MGVSRQTTSRTRPGIIKFNVNTSRKKISVLIYRLGTENFGSGVVSRLKLSGKNATGILCFFSQRLDDFFGSDRELPDSYPYCVVDGVCNGGGSGDMAHLANPFGSKDSSGAGVFNDDHIDFGHVEGSEDFIV